MTPQRKMLLESLSGHLELLGKVRPRKAASPVANRVRKYVHVILRTGQPLSKRLMA